MNISLNNETFQQTRKFKGHMRELIDYLRHGMGNVTEPRARSMFETSADVLAGLVKAFDDYEIHDETSCGETGEAHSSSCPDSEL